MIKAKKSRDIQEKKKKKTRRSLGPRSQVIMGTREGIHNGMQDEGGKRWPERQAMSQLGQGRWVRHRQHL